tara:strand:+ start:43548 stop:44009 length:462 start_codon:yes stop_codon:yes gene_type:complete
LGSKFKKLVEYKELSNLYIDLSEDILKNIKFDKSSKDNQNQLIFFSCIENSLDCEANYIYMTINSDIESIHEFNFDYKWIKLMQIEVIKNIIKNKLFDDGLISAISDSKKRIFSTKDTNIISSNKSNDLKKFTLILSKYKSFNELIRKTLDEC